MVYQKSKPSFSFYITADRPKLPKRNHIANDLHHRLSDIGRQSWAISPITDHLMSWAAHNSVRLLDFGPIQESAVFSDAENCITDKLSLAVLIGLWLLGGLLNKITVFMISLFWPKNLRLAEDFEELEPTCFQLLIPVLVQD